MALFIDLTCWIDAAEFAGMDPGHRPSACARNRAAAASLASPALAIDPAALHTPVDDDRDAAAVPCSARALPGARTSDKQQNERVTRTRFEIISI